LWPVMNSETRSLRKDFYSKHQHSPLIQIQTLLVRCVLRYMMLRLSKRVYVGKLAFPGQQSPQACVLASMPIPANTFLWELNAVLSLDVVTESAVSVIRAHTSQKCPPGNRIMAGTARIANHHCDSNSAVCHLSILTVLPDVYNSQLEPIPDYPIFVVRTIRSIDIGEEITVNYGKDYWIGSKCLCSNCTGVAPIYTTRVERGLPTRE
jgi:SET domain